MNNVQYQTMEHQSQDIRDRHVSRTEPTNVFRSRLAALALVVSGILFVLYPAIRPFSDETSLQGALAFASSSWVLAHSLAMLAFILLTLGLLGVYLRLQVTRVERTALWGLVLSWIGVGLTLPYYGAEVFGLHAIGQAALQQHALASFPWSMRCGGSKALCSSSWDSSCLPSARSSSPSLYGDQEFCSDGAAFRLPSASHCISHSSPRLSSSGSVTDSSSCSPALYSRGAW